MPWKELGGGGAMIVVLLLLYVGSYFAMVERMDWDPFVVVDYRFGGESAEWFFGPIHQIDRRLRPEWWANEATVDTVS
jgi:hypothetical protein